MSVIPRANGRNRGLTFRDGPGVVERSAVCVWPIPHARQHSRQLDITDGQVRASYLIPNHTDFGDSATNFDLVITEQDRDADGIPDWEELALAAYAPLLFFDAETTGLMPTSCNPF